MRLTRTISYALACLCELARHCGEYVQVCEIALAQEIPQAYCQKILLLLSRAGLVESIKGRGFTLVKPVESITTLEVVKALSIGEADDPSQAENYATRLIHEALSNRLNQALAEMSIAEVVKA